MNPYTSTPIPFYIYAFVHLNTCTPVHLYTCTPLNLYTHILVPNTCTPVQLYTPVHPYTCRPTLVHLYTCTPIHLYTYTPIYVYTCTPKPKCTFITNITFLQSAIVQCLYLFTSMHLYT